ncbi:hypothetical protein Tco_0844653 [Tanacetum coccineum]
MVAGRMGFDTYSFVMNNTPIDRVIKTEFIASSERDEIVETASTERDEIVEAASTVRDEIVKAASSKRDEIVEVVSMDIGD